MRESLEQILEKVKGFLGRFSKRSWIIIGCCAVLLIAGITGVCVHFATRPQPLEVVQFSLEDPQNVDNAPVEMTPTPEPTPAGLFVHIKGAVVSPGLLELPEHSRVNDAILAAGGAAENADLNQLNLAELLEDGDQIYIPTKEEAKDAPTPQPGVTSGEETKSATSGKSAASGSSGSSGSSATSKPVLTGKVNINTASSDRLQLLPGIGPALAQRIIDYRAATPFAKIEDIMNVKGIGEKTFEKFKDKLEV